MNREFENSGREMPYRIPPQSLEVLHERILSRTSRRPASSPRTVRRYCLTAAAAAAVLVMGLLVTEYRTRRADTPARTSNRCSPRPRPRRCVRPPQRITTTSFTTSNSKNISV